MFFTKKKKELEAAAEMMQRAGYKYVTPDMVEKIPNKWDVDAYVAIIRDEMIIYTPQWKNNHNHGVQLVKF